MSELTDWQNELQKEAEDILSKINLLDFLSKFGKAKIVGSYALGLMTWRDIDIDLSVDTLKTEDYFQAVAYLFNNVEVERIILADNRALSENLISQGIPKSFYLGIFVKGEGDEEWKIDLRFVEGSLARAEKYIDEIKEKLNDENREIIFAIKKVACSHPKYISKEIGSVDVYDSVLNSGVKNIDDFKKYLNKKGIIL